MAADKDPLCYMVQRKDLDQYSLTRAMAAGAQFRIIDKVISLDQADASLGGGVRLTVSENGKKQCLTAGFLIGADGANSTIRRLITGREHVPGGHPDRILKYPALEADVKVADPLTYPMAFDFSQGIRGYYWMFPRNDHVNIGVYAADPGMRLERKMLETYAKAYFGHTRLEAVKGYPIGVGARLGGGVSEGKGAVLLAGDAAGLAEPLLGEGIYAALKFRAVGRSGH